MIVAFILGSFVDTFIEGEMTVEKMSCEGETSSKVLSSSSPNCQSDDLPQIDICKPENGKTFFVFFHDSNDFS